MVLTKFKYLLEKGSKKFRCPLCGKKRFVRYVDQETGNYLSEDIGRCDREVSCGYHKKPNDGLSLANVLYSRSEKPKPPKASTISKRYLESTLGKYERNSLIQWMATLPGWNIQKAEDIARRYQVGTSKNGWAIFWQIDERGEIRSGKMMNYSDDGHRIKEGYSQDWVHSRLKKAGHLNEFELVQCFFGLHLVKNKPVAIVESEKTAMIASEYLPQFTWLASGQLNGLNEYKMKPLKGRNVVLFPDIGALNKWNEKALEMAHIANIKVSSLLERNASEENKGYDLADYLIQFELEAFQSGKSCESEEETKHIFFNADAPHGFNPWTGEIFDSRGYPAVWDNDN